MEEMLTIEETAKKLHVAPEAVRALLQQGKLKSVQGEQGERIHIADLALFVITHDSSLPPRLAHG